MHVANVLNSSQHETSAMLPNVSRGHADSVQDAQGQEAAELSKMLADEAEVSIENCKMSNQLVLQITCASFLIFVLAEVAGAIIGMCQCVYRMFPLRRLYSMSNSTYM
jgi:hypothetical protein